MIINEIGIEETTKFFLEDPKLCVMGLPDNYLYYLDKHKTFPATPGEVVYGLYKDNQIVATIMFQEHDKNTVVMHFYLSTNNLRKNIVRRFYPVIEEMLTKEYTQKEVMVAIPQSCLHVMEVVQAIGFQFKKTIVDGITWRGAIEDLHYYKTKINKENV